MTRARRSIWTFAGSLLTSATTIGVAFVSTPLLLYWLGNERLGAFRTVTDWLGFLSLLELGIFGASQAFMAGALGRGNWTEVAAAVKAGVRTYARITAVMLLIGAVFVVVAPALVPVREIETGELRLAFVVCLFGFLLLPLNPFRALVEANQRGYLVHGLVLFQSLLVTSLSLLMAWCNAGLAGQAVALLVGNSPFPLMLLWDCMRRHPELRNANPTAEELSQARASLGKLSWPTLLFHLCGKISLYSDNILIARMIGPAAVVPFFITQRMAILLGGQIASVAGATWAALAELYTRGMHTLFHQRFTELTRLIAVLGAAVLVPAAVLCEAFVGLWVGPHCFGGDSVVVLASANAWLLAIVSLWGWVFHATTRVTLLLPSMVAGAVVNLGVSIVATYYLGLSGPLLGTLVYLIGLLAYWFPLLGRHFDMPARPLAAAVFGPLALAGGYAFLLHTFCTRYPVSGWFDLAARMAFAPPCFLALAWLLLLPVAESAQWQGRIRGFLPGRSAAA